jgi:hypothetical protein
VQRQRLQSLRRAPSRRSSSASTPAATNWSRRSRAIAAGRTGADGAALVPPPSSLDSPCHAVALAQSSGSRAAQATAGAPHEPRGARPPRGSRRLRPPRLAPAARLCHEPGKVEPRLGAALPPFRRLVDRSSISTTLDNLPSETSIRDHCPRFLRITTPGQSSHLRLGVAGRRPWNGRRAAAHTGEDRRPRLGMTVFLALAGIRPSAACRGSTNASSLGNSRCCCRRPVQILPPTSPPIRVRSCGSVDMSYWADRAPARWGSYTALTTKRSIAGSR